MSKVVMITGASRGIGLAIAQALQSQGYSVSLGLRQPEVELPLSEDGLLRCYYDAFDPKSAKAWYEQTLAAYGHLDALVLSAGLLKVLKIEDDDEEALDEMLDVNVKANWRLARLCLPELKVSGHGRVISLVSLSGKRVKGLSVGYSVSKFAQLALHQGIRNAAFDDGVRCCAICPSWVNTDMARAVSRLAPEDMTQPEDLAKLVAQVMALPNSAVVDELTVNCALEK